MRRSNIARIYRRIASFFLIILFCGYLGSITFFPHTHIVDGITVVHSHPYKSLPGSNPVDHNHSKNGFLLIQFISSFITTAPVLFFGVVVTREFFRRLLFNQVETEISNFFFFGANRPRAPSV